MLSDIPSEPRSCYAYAVLMAFAAVILLSLDYYRHGGIFDYLVRVFWSLAGLAWSARFAYQSTEFQNEHDARLMRRASVTLASLMIGGVLLLG